jgi:hypothetical protein
VNLTEQSGSAGQTAAEKAAMAETQRLVQFALLQLSLAMLVVYSCSLLRQQHRVAAASDGTGGSVGNTREAGTGGVSTSISSSTSASTTSSASSSSSLPQPVAVFGLRQTLEQQQQRQQQHLAVAVFGMWQQLGLSPGALPSFVAAVEEGPRSIRYNPDSLLSIVRCVEERVRHQFLL